MKAVCKAEARYKEFKRDNPNRATNRKLSRFYRRSMNRARRRYFLQVIRQEIE
jgi:hypothetical protein